MKKIANHQPVLQNYFEWEQIIQVIKTAVYKRTEKDFYGWIDFKQCFLITNAYYCRRKHLVQNNKKMQKYLKNTKSGQSTGAEDRYVR
jgi:predicted protein tyrosine phosphatase